MAWEILHRDVNEGRLLGRAKVQGIKCSLYWSLPGVFRASALWPMAVQVTETRYASSPTVAR